MNNKWNRNNALWMLLYAVLYAAATAVVCVTGSIHPIFFVCYQITAGLLLSPIIIRAFRRVQAPGAAICLFLGILLLLFIIRDAVMWHVVPLIVISVLAEIFPMYLCTEQEMSMSPIFPRPVPDTLFFDQP